MILGITGHRPPTLFGGYNIPPKEENKIYQEMLFRIGNIKPKKIISGMAQGVDTFAAEIAIELKVPLVAAVPCDDQDSQWPDAAKKHYRDLLKYADVRVITPGPYTKDCMKIRDYWIVDNSTHLLAVWNGQRFGGTFATVRHAEKQIAKGREYNITVINPIDIG
jgi:uncharacterized phage-like protein YoqJ